MKKGEAKFVATNYRFHDQNKRFRVDFHECIKGSAAKIKEAKQIENARRCKDERSSVF